ncbi:hypothetical protein FJP86_03120 [Bacillus velezensis]|uniref:hypothetical protein n=1 Tax=Bacillus TaxID=1386 RepID=UPI00073C1F42|nr:MULTISPECIES: hypothetical protein [Bacillus amyloliquefaciens group]KTF59563.1 hypothetical protein AR691_15030 [Bacillus amyloliquefaciens]NOL13548.1 hypothetical protein [Bacillus velezensis]ULR35871.1 hypothetical protein MG974_03280 [Bacillus velezensis]
MTEIQNERNKRFKNLAEKRTQKILDTLDLIANLSVRNNYNYSEEEVNEMFGAIENKTSEVKNFL